MVFCEPDEPMLHVLSSLPAPKPAIHFTPLVGFHTSLAEMNSSGTLSSSE